MSKLDLILDTAVAKLPVEIIPRASSSVAQDHVRLREDIKDLDLFVSDETFDDLVRQGFRARVKGREDQ